MQVTRTWYSKKLGGFVTRTYEYKYKKRRGGKSRTLVGKSGKPYKERIDEVLKSITDPATKADAKAVIKQAIRDGEKLTERSLASKITDDKYEKMLINAGYSISSFEADTGIKFSDFSNKANWSGDVFTYGGVKYLYKFNYEGNMLTAI